MAKLNNLYIFVKDEQLSFGVDVTEHTVESGIDISDHVRRRARTLSITGEFVGTKGAATLSQIQRLHEEGKYCLYVGCVNFPKCLITDFNISNTPNIWGGCEFSMTLKEIRTASTAYKKTKATKNTGTQQKTSNSTAIWVNHTVKKGDTVWALVAAKNAPYKNLNRPQIGKKTYSACDWVMQMNQSAFSRKGDFGTLQIGKKLVVGKRK